MITNTTRQVNQDPMAHLAKALAIGSSAAIEAQEAAGQFELCQSSQLPTKGSGDPIWEKWGVVFGNPVVGDEMFSNVTLPPGWSVKPTEHPMWSDLVDDKGRSRAGIFYKAAFYDRSAHINPRQRFSVLQNYDIGDDAVQLYAADGHSRIFMSSVIKTGARDWSAIDAAVEKCRIECESWLDANRPDWRDPVLSWN